MGFAGFEYGLWGISFGGSPIGYEASLSRFKVQRQLTSYELFCSSTNFVYSNHVGVMPWAHNSSVAAQSHQVPDLGMWSRENVNHTRVSTCNIR